MKCCTLNFHLPVNPTEYFWIIWVCGTVGDPMSPVLSQTMLLGQGLQAGGGDGDLHDNLGFV